jgi:hypothetical protein
MRKISSKSVVKPVVQSALAKTANANEEMINDKVVRWS